jgi:hypothetical protein
MHKSEPSVIPILPHAAARLERVTEIRDHVVRLMQVGATWQEVGGARVRMCNVGEFQAALFSPFNPAPYDARDLPAGLPEQ